MTDLKNFGMMIPATSIDPYRKPDPNGVPIYAECPSKGDLCACTGACRKILGYDTDPEKIKEYHAAIEKQNSLPRNISQGLNTLNGDGTIRTWEFNPNNK